MSGAAAQIFGAVGALGLALLLAAARRDLRIAGLAAWAVGAGGLVAYLAPHGHHRLLAAAARGRRRRGARRRLARAARAVAARARDARLRAGADPGARRLDAGEPAAAALRASSRSRRSPSRGSSRATTGGSASSARSRGRSRLFVGWEGLSFLWTKDVRQGAIELLFFVLPFGLLAVALARLPWSRTWVLALYVQFALMALVFAVIGIVQYETRNIFWNPKVRVDNAYAPSGWFYRVNSVFYDPSIYGRFLVVAILASLVLVLRRRGDPLWAVAAALTIVITWAGLLPSFSQSSFAALLIGVTLCAVFVWRRHSLFLVAAMVVVLVVAGFASPQIRHRLEGKGSSSLSNVTSGRSKLASRGLKLVVHHPVLGVGVGGFKRAYADLAHLRGKDPKAAASHTTPITVGGRDGRPGPPAAARARRRRRSRRPSGGSATASTGTPVSRSD